MAEVIIYSRNDLGRALSYAELDANFENIKYVIENLGIDPYVYKTSAYTITNSDYYVEANGTFNVTLPTAVGNAGKPYVIKNTGTGVITIVTTGSQLIDNLPSFTLAFYDTVTVESNGTGWLVTNPQTKQFIRIYNNTGSIIPKGTALNIVSAYSGVPSVSLPIASNHTGNCQVIGLAYIDIPVASEGVAINSGILSGLNLSTYSVGDTLYLSDVVSGGLMLNSSFSSFAVRKNKVGYVTSNSSTIGTIQVDIENEDPLLDLTATESIILEGNVISTGVYEFTGITRTSTTTFNIAKAGGWIVSNTYTNATSPDVKNVIYSGSTGNTTPYINTADSTYVLLTTGSTITLQPTFPTPQQRRDNIFLGKVNHPDRTAILNVNNTVDFDVSPVSMIRDLWTPLKLINQGVVTVPNGVNLNINTTGGTLWGNGINWVNDQKNPDSVLIPSRTPATFQYRTQSGSQAAFTDTIVIDPGSYDVAGTKTTISGNSYTNQRVYLFPTGLIRVQYGQHLYSSLAKAIADLPTEQFVEYPNNRDNAVLIGLITIKKGTTDLTDTNNCQFSFVSKFGELVGGAAGGIATTNLQNAYNNSPTPEILTNATLGPVSFKEGTGDDAISVIEVLNGTSGQVFDVTGQGKATARNLQITNLSSTSGLGKFLSVDTAGNVYYELASTSGTSGSSGTSGISGSSGTSGISGSSGTSGISGSSGTSGTSGSSGISGVPYTGATENVNIGVYSYLGTKIQLGTPTGNTPSNFTVAIKSVTADGLYIEGNNLSTRILLQAQNLTGGNGQIELLANTNNNSFLRLGLSYLRESSGFLAVSATNFAPTSTLHVRGASASAGNAFLIQNSTPTALFTVSNAGLATFNPAGASGDAIEITNGGYFKQANVRFRGSANSLLFYDSSYNTFFTLSPTQTLSSVPFVQSGYAYSNLGVGFGNAYYSMTNTYTNILGGYLHGIEVKNTYTPGTGSPGIFRDLYIAPVSLGANVQDWRGIEVVGGSTSVSTLIKLNNGSSDIFVVKGDSKIGFFGATPVVKQTLGATTASSSYTATEQGMLQRVYDAIRTYGLGT